MLTTKATCCPLGEICGSLTKWTRVRSCGVIGRPVVSAIATLRMVRHSRAHLLTSQSSGHAILTCLQRLVKEMSRYGPVPPSWAVQGLRKYQGRAGLLPVGHQPLRSVQGHADP